MKVAVPEVPQGDFVRSGKREEVEARVEIVVVFIGDHTNTRKAGVFYVMLVNVLEGIKIENNHLLLLREDKQNAVLDDWMALHYVLC